MKNNCTHYWVISVAVEPTSKGRCKKCHAIKTFSNTPEDIKVSRINSVTGVETFTRDISFGRQNPKSY